MYKKKTLPSCTVLIYLTVTVPDTVSLRCWMRPSGETGKKRGEKKKEKRTCIKLRVWWNEYRSEKTCLQLSWENQRSGIQSKWRFFCRACMLPSKIYIRYLYALVYVCTVVYLSGLILIHWFWRADLRKGFINMPLFTTESDRPEVTLCSWQDENSKTKKIL